MANKLLFFAEKYVSSFCMLCKSYSYFLQQNFENTLATITLLLLSMTYPVLANSVDPDQLASDLDLHCLPSSM